MERPISTASAEARARNAQRGFGFYIGLAVRQAIEDAEARLERLTQQVADVVSTWSMAPVVEAYQAMRGVAFLTAVTFVAEIGDVRRFETPRQLMAYLGLVPSERSTGEQVRRGSITKARVFFSEGFS